MSRPGERRVPTGSSAHQAWARGVLSRSGGVCAWCGGEGPFQADHVVPVADGGDPLAPDNGQALCRGCHQHKTSQEAARRAHQARLAKQARKPRRAPSTDTQPSTEGYTITHPSGVKVFVRYSGAEAARRRREAQN